MSNLLSRIAIALPIVIALNTINATEAHARRGLVLITWGEDVMHVQDVPEDIRADLEAETEPGVALGYHYTSFGIFFLDVWRWDGKFVLYAGDTIWNVPDDELAQIMSVASVDDLSVPLSYRFPPGLLIILGIIAIAIAVYIYRRRRRLAEEQMSAADHDFLHGMDNIGNLGNLGTRKESGAP